MAMAHRMWCCLQAEKDKTVAQQQKTAQVQRDAHELRSMMEGQGAQVRQASPSCGCKAASLGAAAHCLPCSRLLPAAACRTAACCGAQTARALSSAGHSHNPIRQTLNMHVGGTVGGGAAAGEALGRNR